MSSWLKFQLIPPYIIGTGDNLGEVILFIETSQVQISIGDVLWIQEHSFHVQFVKDIEDDYFEKCSRITSRLVVNTASSGLSLDFNEPLEGAVMGVTVSVKDPTTIYKLVP